MESKLGQEPAFSGLSQITESGYVSIENFGMSKRFYAATSILGNLLVGIDDPSIKNTIKLAYELTDELLKQENE